MRAPLQVQKVTADNLVVITMKVAIFALCNFRIFDRHCTAKVYIGALMRARRSRAFMRGFISFWVASHGAWGKSSFMRSLNSPPRDIADDGRKGGKP